MKPLNRRSPPPTRSSPINPAGFFYSPSLTQRMRQVQPAPALVSCNLQPERLAVPASRWLLVGYHLYDYDGSLAKCLPLRQQTATKEIPNRHGPVRRPRHAKSTRPACRWNRSDFYRGTHAHRRRATAQHALRQTRQNRLLRDVRRSAADSCFLCYAIILQINYKILIYIIISSLSSPTIPFPDHAHQITRTKPAVFPTRALRP